MINARFSQHARRALFHARLLAQKYHHAVIDTDHLLLGIWRTDGSLGWQALHDLEIDLSEAEDYLSQLHPQVDVQQGKLDYSVGVRTTFIMAKDESYWLGHHYIGTEHILLGLVRSGVGESPNLLRELKLTGMQIRRRVRRLLNNGITELNLEAARRLARLSELSRRVLNATAYLARQHQHPNAGLEHLLLVLAREKRSVVSSFLVECGLDQARLEEDLKTLQVDAIAAVTALDEVIDRAVDSAEALGTHYTGTEHILLAMTFDKIPTELLNRYEVDVTRLQQKLIDVFKR